MAISTSDRRAVLFDTVFYEEGIEACAAVTGGDLPKEVPNPYNKIFTEAAEKFDMPAAFLAAIFFAGEHGHSWPEPPPPYGQGPQWATSPKGASGPFQFMPLTWGAHGQDGDKDGDKDVMDLTDAAYGGAEFLASLGAKNGEPRERLVGAADFYNSGNNEPAPGYVEGVMEAYDQFSKGGGGSNASQGSCGGLGISADGFVFPLKSTQKRIREAQPLQYWCPDKDTYCHHDYAAADIVDDTGTPVLAARGGVVIKIDSSPQRIHIKGEDGKWYYYTHMLAGSIAKKGVQVGDTVAAGDEIGAVGIDADTGNDSTHHLHFDVSKVESTYYRDMEYDGYALAKANTIDPQPALVESFKELAKE